MQFRSMNFDQISSVLPVWYFSESKEQWETPPTRAFLIRSTINFCGYQSKFHFSGEPGNEATSLLLLGSSKYIM